MNDDKIKDALDLMCKVNYWALSDYLPRWVDSLALFIVEAIVTDFQCDPIVVKPCKWLITEHALNELSAERLATILGNQTGLRTR